MQPDEELCKGASVYEGPFRRFYARHSVCLAPAGPKYFGSSCLKKSVGGPMLVRPKRKGCKETRNSLFLRRMIFMQFYETLQHPRKHMLLSRYQHQTQRVRVPNVSGFWFQKPYHLWFLRTFNYWVLGPPGIRTKTPLKEPYHSLERNPIFGYFGKGSSRLPTTTASTSPAMPGRATRSGAMARCLRRFGGSIRVGTVPRDLTNNTHNMVWYSMV